MADGSADAADADAARVLARTAAGSAEVDFGEAAFFTRSLNRSGT